MATAIYQSHYQSSRLYNHFKRLSLGLLHYHQPARTQKSSSQLLLYQPATTINFQSKAFSITVPAVWNSLSSVTKSSATITTFKAPLKTVLYCIRHNLTLNFILLHGASLSNSRHTAPPIKCSFWHWHWHLVLPLCAAGWQNASLTTVSPGVYHATACTQTISDSKRSQLQLNSVWTVSQQYNWSKYYKTHTLLCWTMHRTIGQTD